MTDTQRYHRWLPWILFAAAAVVRLVYVWLGFEVAPQDTADYDEIALNLIGGEGFVARQNWFGFELLSWRPPLYPFFLAAIYGLFGYGHLAVRLIQTVMGAVTAVLVYRLGRTVHPPSAPIAGVIAVLYGPLVGSANEIMSEGLFTFLLVLSVYLLVGANGDADSSPWKRTLTAGAAIGLAALTRPVGLILWLVQAGIWLRQTTAARRPILWLAVGTMAVIIPWTIRNWVVHGSLVAISTQSGFIISRSNALEPDWRKGELSWRIDREAFERTPSEIERDHQWLRRGLSFPLRHPAVYVRLVGERFLRFLYFMTPTYNFWFATVFPLAVLGMWRFGRRDGFALMAMLVLASTAAFCLILYGSARFRLPLEPFLILFAAAFAHDCWRRWDRRLTLVAAGTLLFVNGVAWWQSEAVHTVMRRTLMAFGLK